MSLQLSQLNLHADRLVKQQSSHVTICTCVSMQTMDLAELILLYVFKSSLQKTRTGSEPSAHNLHIPTEISELHP